MNNKAIRYEAYTHEGEKVKGVLSTDSEEAAYDLLEKEKLIPYKLRLIGPRRSPAEILLSLLKPTTQDLIEFTRQLASLLSSGINLRRGLVAQRDQSPSLGLRYALGKVVEDIEGGTRLSDALRARGRTFPDFYVSAIRIGEASGDIPSMLRQLAEVLQRRKVINDKVKRSMVYPAITLSVATAAAVILVGYSLPTLTDMLRSGGGEMPMTTRILVSVSDALRVHWITVVFAVLATVLIVAVSFRSRPASVLRDKALLRVPVVGRIVLANNMFILTSTIATLLRAGVSPVEALRLAQDSLPNAVFRGQISVVLDRVTAGTRLGLAFTERSGLPPLISQAVVTGEMQGGLEETMSGLAEYYEDVANNAATGIADLIQPLVIIIVAAIVGFVAAAVVSGIYSTLGAVGG